MHCYDCLQEGRADSAGIGMCARCGLFTCQDHGHVVREHVHRAGGLGRTTSPVQARRFVCDTCRTAETAH
ncbi:hypothetical protein GCM10010129_69400 [Streptomyces fumigatiscleroticus]|nr:hypothetical protein GCM10010129_69400 [Streptomyces fumigatiscleroticus]